MRDILLHVDTYAEPTPPAAIEQAVAFAQALGCQISALATHIDFRVPQNWLAERLLNINRLAEIEENKSLEAGRNSLKHFEQAATAAGVFGESIVARADLNAVGECAARHARTRDLCLVPIGDRAGGQRLVAEDAIFRSGRPALVFNPDTAPLPRGRLKRVAVAWDGGRCAARAVGDALSVLKAAEEVRVFTAVGEKPSARSGHAKDLVRHVRVYGVEARIDEVDGSHGNIGASINAYLEEFTPDLLVMGAYGSSKMKEFILGGATEHVLNDLRLPVLLSH
jgi:nucleotide-binding universal stress UspA family protein